MTNSGVVQEPNGIPVGSTLDNETSPAASAGPGGGWGVAHVQSQATGQGIYLHTVAPK